MRTESKKISIQSTKQGKTPYVSLKKDRFDIAIEKNGYEVILEKAVRCACKSKNSGHIGSCKNCGGSGWFFINPIITRMLVQSMSMNPQYKSWGIMASEISTISAKNEDKLSFMDRITVMNTLSESSEVVHLTEEETKTIGRLNYTPKEVYCVFLFIDSDDKHRLLKDDEYELENEFIILSDELLAEINNSDISVSIRYRHNPQYHIIECVRETMTAPTELSGERKEQSMPVNARAKRVDLIKDMENYTGDRLFDNSFDVKCLDYKKCHQKT